MILAVKISNYDFFFPQEKDFLSSVITHAAGFTMNSIIVVAQQSNVTCI